MSPAYHLFDRFGVEIEYMIVADDTLAVRPIADRILIDSAGRPCSEVEMGTLIWSNELVSHVIELKTNGPAETLVGLAAHLQEHVGLVNARLAAHGARLLPTGMHPTMDPGRETRLWPGEFNEVYATFDRIFSCEGHGWSNLQSTHLNLPFADDAEFGRLHAAVRVLLPLLPALTASSPMMDGRLSGLTDTRLDVYRANARRVPQVTGAVVPEPAFTREDYTQMVLAPIYEALAPHDPTGIISHEWVNARGAIARFDRRTIEVRVLDTQECPRADIALLRLIVATLEALTAQRWSSLAEQCRADTQVLAALFRRVSADGDLAVFDEESYLRLFGVHAAPLTAGELWQSLFEQVIPRADRVAPAFAPVRTVLTQGCLSRRITAALGPNPGPARISAVYRTLAACLAEGRLFDAAAV